jgi:signal transduction histidine kinase
MKLCLVSGNPDLRETCEAAAEGGPQLELQVVSRFEADIEADIVLWDVMPDSLPRPELLRAGARQHLVTVDASASDALRHWNPGVPVLLKPIAPDVLRPFLIAAAQRRRTPSNGSLPERRTTFFSKAARELRGPLNALDGYCALLLDRTAGGALTASQAGIVERMRESVRNASRIAEGLCSATSSPDGDRCVRLPLEDCIRAAIADSKFIIEERQIAVELLVEGTAEQPFLVPARARYALAAMIEYAAANSPRAGTVGVSAYPVVRDSDGGAGRAGHAAHANAYRIDVRDSGAALSVGELNALFDESGDGQPSASRVGSFALTLTKKIITGIGGTIFSDSKATGVTISVVVPWRSRTYEPAHHHPQRTPAPFDRSGMGGQQRS